MANWKEAMEQVPFSIRTGDGITYKPQLVQKYVRESEYSGQQYQVVSASGTIVSKQLPKGRRYELEFCFVGANNKTLSKQFEVSARDKRPWLVKHPFYGVTNCQTLSLRIDDTPLDTSIIRATVVEVLKLTPWKVTQPSINALQAKINDMYRSIAANGAIGQSSTANTEKATESIARAEASASKAVSLAKDVLAVKKYVSYALNELNNGYGQTLGYMVALQSLIDTPSLVAADLGTKLDILSNALDNTIEHIRSLTNPSYYDTLMLYLIGQSTVGAMSKAISSDASRYSANEVYVQLDKFKSAYNTMLSAFDEYESYMSIPSSDSAALLRDIVTETEILLESNLLTAARDRTYMPETDTNLVLIAFRLYGDTSEATLDKLKRYNRFNAIDMMRIKRGTSISYSL